MIGFDLSEVHLSVQELVRQFVAREVLPDIGRNDSEGRFRPLAATQDGQAGPARTLHPLPPRRLRFRLHQPGHRLRGAGIRRHLPAGHSFGPPGPARPDPAELGKRSAEGALVEAPGPRGEDRHLRLDRARRRKRRGGNTEHGPARREALHSQRRKEPGSRWPTWPTTSWCLPGPIRTSENAGTTAA